MEKTFEFDQVAQPLPKIGSRSPSGAGEATVGKKRAKNEARRAAAIAAAEEAESEKGGILGFFKKENDDGEIENDRYAGVKFLENSTWVGISLLILWEFYINSPLFDRTSSIIPVVF